MPQNHWRIIDEPLNFNLVCQISNAYAVAKEWDAFLEANPDVADCFEMAPAIYVPIMNRIRDIDLFKVRNYYVACGYTDLRLRVCSLVKVWPRVRGLPSNRWLHKAESPAGMNCLPFLGHEKCMS